MEYEVKHETENSRFVTVVDGFEAFVEYELKEDKLILYHTFTPHELRGRGIAGKVVRFALNYARENNLKVIPTCSYVSAYMQKHSEYSDLKAI